MANNIVTINTTIQNVDANSPSGTPQIIRQVPTVVFNSSGQTNYAEYLSIGSGGSVSLILNPPVYSTVYLRNLGPGNAVYEISGSYAVGICQSVLVPGGYFVFANPGTGLFSDPNVYISGLVVKPEGNTQIVIEYFLSN